MSFSNTFDIFTYIYIWKKTCSRILYTVIEFTRFTFFSPIRRWIEHYYKVIDLKPVPMNDYFYLTKLLDLKYIESAPI